MIFFESILNLPDIVKENNIKTVYLPVRRLLSDIRYKGVETIRVLDLAPSMNLLYMAKMGLDFKTYTNTYLNEICSRPHVKTILNEIVARSKNENIAVVCYCTNEKECHRSILAGILDGLGAKTVTDFSIENYKPYYDSFLETCKLWDKDKEMENDKCTNLDPTR